MATAARRKAELILDDVTVVSHRRQFSIDELLLAGGLVALGEVLDQVAFLAVVPAQSKARYECVSGDFPNFLEIESFLRANFDAYPLLQVILIHDEQPLLLLVLRRLRVYHLFLQMLTLMYTIQRYKIFI